MRHILDKSCNARTVQEANLLAIALALALRSFCSSCMLHVREALQEVRGFASLGHNLWAYAYLRMLHHKDANDMRQIER